MLSISLDPPCLDKMDGKVEGKISCQVTNQSYGGVGTKHKPSSCAVIHKMCFLGQLSLFKQTSPFALLQLYL